MRVLAYICLVLPGVLLHQASRNIFGESFLFFALFFAAVMFVVIFVHELGHALAVRNVGWRIRTFAVFPLAYRFPQKRLSFWASSSGDLGGMVTFDAGGFGTSAKIRRIAAAGPLANIGFGLLWFLLASLHPGGIFENIAGALAIASLFIGLGNALPWRSTKGAPSDGEVWRIHWASRTRGAT